MTPYNNFINSKLQHQIFNFIKIQPAVITGTHQ